MNIDIKWVSFDEYKEDTDKPITSFSNKWFFLSNFYPCKINHFGQIYPSVEHAYQASKSLEESIRESIRNAPTAEEAKRMGREVALRHGWNDMKLQVMEGLLRIKFAKHTDLSLMLINTGSRELIEGNYWHDIYWGVCNGKGENHLGKLLMRVRDSLIPHWGLLNFSSDDLVSRIAEEI